jgi:hypothetical protein
VIRRVHSPTPREDPQVIAAAPDWFAPPARLFDPRIDDERDPRGPPSGEHDAERRVTAAPNAAAPQVGIDALSLGVVHRGVHLDELGAGVVEDEHELGIGGVCQHDRGVEGRAALDDEAGR